MTYGSPTRPDAGGFNAAGKAAPEGAFATCDSRGARRRDVMPLRDLFGMLFAGSIVSRRIVSPSPERSPTTRVGALGDVENAVVHQGPVDKKGNVLLKPFAAGALLQKVQTLLDAAAD